MKLPGITFPLVLGAFQILVLGLFGAYVSYDTQYLGGNGGNRLFYPEFQDIHVMMFIGFGFLMTFLKKYGYGAISYNLLLGSVTIQWATLLNNWIGQNMKKDENRFFGHVSEININVERMINTDFTVTAILISFGAVIGKASRLQLLVMMIVECVFFAINENVLNEYLRISDAGGSVVLHMFGACFGLAVSTVLRNSEDKSGKEGSEYHSDLFSMIGTLFLWVYWPSFNGGMLGVKPFQQNRAIVNTYYSLTGSVISTFVISCLVNKKFRFNMVHIQNATIAGGVAVGTCADLMIKPWGAILIGILAGAMSVIGFAHITPRLNRHVFHDTCGVLNLHAIPGCIGGITGAIAAASIPIDSYEPGGWQSIYGFDNGRRLVIQGGFQIAAIMVTIAFGVGGGWLTGIVVSLLDCPDEDDRFDDKAEFEMPDHKQNTKMSDMELGVQNKNANYGEH